MRWRISQWLPEGLLGALTIFFVFRELGTFPAPWEDSSLYTLVAKTFASGKGYALPILREYWQYPYLLSVGPTVIMPVGIMIRVFGYSTEVARIVPAFYLLTGITCFYTYTLIAAGKKNARMATALLITLSAYINSGKPVLGSVPALFYLFLGLLLLRIYGFSWKGVMFSGLCFGLAILTKSTFVLILPALVFAYIADRLRSERELHREWRLIVMITIASLLFLPWLLLQMLYHPGFFDFLYTLFTRPPGNGLLSTLLEKFSLLLRFQYAYFGLLFLFGIVGLWDQNLQISREKRYFLFSLILLFTLHFAVREGWYRHLLPAHVLLLPFVPLGARRLLGRAAFPLLCVFILAQALWQLDHRGSSRSITGEGVVAIIQSEFADQNLLIQHSEIFVRLPENPHWLYYPIEGTQELIPPDLNTLSAEERCWPLIRKANEKDLERYAPSELRQLAGSYFLFPPLEKCSDN